MVKIMWIDFDDIRQTHSKDSLISTRTASAAARSPVDCSKLHQQPLDAVLRPTFVHKLCYKLPSVVTFTFTQTSKFCPFR